MHNFTYSEKISDCAVDYDLLLAQLEAVTEGESNTIANLANASAILNMCLQNINWVGFYLVHDNQLVLGPFQGKPACIRIDFCKGVCGTAAATDCTQVVTDVHQFPGHIACDSASNSEIVIPLHHQGKVIGVLDIDSPLIARFTETDKIGLESCARLLESACDRNCPYNTSCPSIPSKEIVFSLPSFIFTTTGP